MHPHGHLVRQGGMSSRPALRRPASLVPVVLLVLALSACSTVSGTASGPAGGTASSPVAPVLPSSTAETAPATTSADDTGQSAGSSGTDAPTTDPATATSSENQDTATATPEPPTSAPPTTDTGASPTSAPVTSAGTAGPVRDWDHFRSPSGNITCLIAPDPDGVATVRCDLLESAIRERHDCGGTGDWGQSVELTRGKAASMICISDTVADPSAPALPYGASTQVGPISCTSSVDGMYCSDDTGHGFRLAKASYEVR